MSRRFAATIGAWILIQLLVVLGPLAAQTNIETNAPGVQLNFSTPGARSLALGGTFLGRADDATAAYANPAGLANLPEPEASVEFRNWTFNHIFTDRGRLLGSPTDIPPDTLADLVDGEATDEVLGPSFASFVYPRRRWAVALYFHTLADFEASFATQGAFLEGDADTASRLFPVASRSELEIRTLGLSFAYRLSESFSLGLGISRYEFSIDSDLERFALFLPSGRFSPFGQIGDPPTVTNSQSQQGTDDALGFTLGALWRLNPRWQVGGVYRDGPSFDFIATLESFGVVTPSDAKFRVPDQWGIGVMFQVTNRLTLGSDYYRVEYSDVAEDVVVILGSSTANEYAADDGNELHAGLEYLIAPAGMPQWLRFGVWHGPTPGMYYRGGDLQEQARFRRRDAAVHWAGGWGLATTSYQVDLGIDYSERNTTFSASTVVRF